MRRPQNTDKLKKEIRVLASRQKYLSTAVVFLAAGMLYLFLSL